MIDFARMPPPPAPVATGPSPAPLSRALYAAAPPQSVVAAAHAAAQAAAGVPSRDTPQSATSELSAGSPAPATAGTLSGADNDGWSRRSGRWPMMRRRPARRRVELILLC